MNTNTNYKYIQNLNLGDRFMSGMSVVYTVKGIKTIPGFRRRVVVIETVEGPTVIRPIGTLTTLV